jgi:hypothetical protein
MSLNTAAYAQFQSIQGPTDPNLTHTLTEGYQPVSRIGEVVMNCFVDAYEFAQLPPQGLKQSEISGKPAAPPAAQEGTVEPKPYFHEWATVTPGMICLSRKARNATFRNYVAAETATPVVGCAAGLKMTDANNFYFAGVCRSKTIRPIDDGTGPQIDEYFTMAIGGMVTMLNNSSEPIFPGDVLEWTLWGEKDPAAGAGKRTKTGPRRVSVKIAAPTSERSIGRALTFAKPGEYFDLLIKSC